MFFGYIVLAVILGGIIAFAWHELSRTTPEPNFGLTLLRRRLTTKRERGARHTANPGTQPASNISSGL